MPGPTLLAFIVSVSRRGFQQFKIAVVGTINRDRIILPDGRVISGYGGILFNLIPLSQLFGEQACLTPVVNIGHDHARAIENKLHRLTNLDPSAIRFVDRPNNQCTLTYHDESAKSEILRGCVGAVTRPQLRRILDSDLILVNFISGADISQRNLVWLRNSANKMIYIDFHSRTLGRRRNGSRFLRVPPAWREYLATADFLQLNRLEFELLAGSTPSGRVCTDFVARHLESVRVLIVTSGNAGCHLVYREAKKLVYRNVPPGKTGPIANTTGCGDVFAAGFVYASLQGYGGVTAAAFANDLAGYAAGCRSIADLDFHCFRLPRTGRK